MAGAGYKLFSTGDVLSASDVNTYLMQQTVMSFASSAARTTALASVLAEGMVTYLQDTNVVEIYTGAAWVSLDDPNAIQNSIVDAKGDIISATADNTPSRLAVGANNTVLTADSTTATGLKWATPATGATFVGCQATANGTTQSYTQWTRVAINFSTEAFDTNGFHDNSTNNSRITIPTGYGGKYLFYGSYSIGTVPSQSFIYLMKNGNLLSDPLQAGNFGNTYGNSNQIATGAIITEGAAGDYFTANIYGDYATGTKTVYANLTCVYLGA